MTECTAKPGWLCVLSKKFCWQVLENKRLDLDASKSKVRKARKDIMEQKQVRLISFTFYRWALDILELSTQAQALSREV